MSNSIYLNKSGIQVPRVTEILKHIGDKSSLCGWANYLGFKNINYDDLLSSYSIIGDFAHKKIELYINNENKNINIPNNLYNMGTNAFSGFKSWFDDVVSNNEVEVIYSEYTIVGSQYGGTIDLLMKIDNKVYLIDFKTSSQVRFEYILQLCAYKRLLKEEENIEIDGMIIVKSERNYSESYKEFIIFNNSENKEFINLCDCCFSNALTFYINYKKCIKIFNNGKKFTT